MHFVDKAMHLNDEFMHIIYMIQNITGVTYFLTIVY